MLHRVRVSASSASDSPVCFLKCFRFFDFFLSELPSSGDHLTTHLSAQLDLISSIRVHGEQLQSQSPCCCRIAAVFCLSLSPVVWVSVLLPRPRLDLFACHDCKLVDTCWLTHIWSKMALNTSCRVSAFGPCFWWTVTGDEFYMLRGKEPRVGMLLGLATSFQPIPLVRAVKPPLNPAQSCLHLCVTFASESVEKPLFSPAKL